MVSVLGVGLLAQKTTQINVGGGGSPHVKSEWTIDGAHLSITYGRPSLKGRPEATLMPVGQTWRLGADEPTLLTTDKPLKFGALSLVAGTYTLNAAIGANEWQLLVGTLATPPQWGIPYRADLEKGRAPMKLGRAASPAETLTISVDDTPAGATLRIEWGTKSATIPFTVG